MKTVIGLTGPIGAGKSTVAQRFAERGFYVVDADRVARTIVEKGSAVLPKLANAFGSEILEPDGSLDRKKLAALAFASKENTQLLNDLTHPAIISEVNNEIESCQQNLVLLDAPQLFESGCDKMCSTVVGVLADRDIRLKRVQERDSLTTEQIINRIKIQYPDSFYLEHCQHIVYNNDDTEALIERVDEVIDTVLREI